jgi:broad specificity phosphatase PhoE
MHELETTQEPIVIVSHQATLRMVYAHLMGADRASAPKLVVPVHTVVKITYDPWHKPTEERCAAWLPLGCVLKRCVVQIQSRPNSRGGGSRQITDGCKWLHAETIR